MLDPWEERSLRLLELHTDLGDERFAEGLRNGRPREPREYRQRRWQRAAIAIPIALAALVFVGQPVLLAALLAAAVVVGCVGWCLAG